MGRQPPAEPDVLPRPRFLRGRRWFPVRAWSPLRMTVWRIMVVSPRWTYVPLVARVLSIPCLDGLRGRTRRPTEGLLEFVVRGQMLTSKQSPHESQLPLPFKRPQLAASLSECILPFEQLITQRFGVLATLLLKDLDDLLLMPSQADISPEPAQLHFCEKRCKRQPLVAPRLVAQTTPFFPGKSHLNHASVVHELHANKPACCNAIEHPTPELEHCSQSPSDQDAPEANEAGYGNIHYFPCPSATAGNIRSRAIANISRGNAITAAFKEVSPAVTAPKFTNASSDAGNSNAADALSGRTRRVYGTRPNRRRKAATTSWNFAFSST